MLLTLILLNLCHFFGDYSHLSTSWMLSAKSKGTPLLPIFAHACMHMGLMFLALVIFIQPTHAQLAICCLLQLFSHFGIDVLKGKLNVWYPVISNPAQKPHWYVFGIDQTLHQLVIILMAFICN